MGIESHMCVLFAEEDKGLDKAVEECKYVF
jgi:hypothetical protein